MDASFYSTPAWRDLRELALARDGNRCTVARLLGGACSQRLDVHHITPIEEGGDPLDLDNTLTACASHHPMLHAVRRAVLRYRQRGWKRCTRHRHPYRIGREECERRMNGVPASSRLTGAAH